MHRGERLATLPALHRGCLPVSALAVFLPGAPGERLATLPALHRGCLPVSALDGGRKATFRGLGTRLLGLGGACRLQSRSQARKAGAISGRKAVLALWLGPKSEKEAVSICRVARRGMAGPRLGGARSTAQPAGWSGRNEGFSGDPCGHSPEKHGNNRVK